MRTRQEEVMGYNRWPWSHRFFRALFTGYRGLGQQRRNCEFMLLFFRRGLRHNRPGDTFLKSSSELRTQERGHRIIVDDLEAMNFADRFLREIEVQSSEKDIPSSGLVSTEKSVIVDFAVLFLKSSSESARHREEVMTVKNAVLKPLALNDAIFL